MQLKIVNQDYLSLRRGDILAVVPDTHVWSPLEVASLWLANDPAGLPDEYKMLAEGGSFGLRTSGNFPNPHFAVVRFPSNRCDLNLGALWMEEDPDETGATQTHGGQLWFLDLDDLPPGQRSSLEAPGGEGTLGSNRLSAIKNRYDSTGLNAAWTGNTQLGDAPHRHSSTEPRDRLGVSP